MDNRILAIIPAYNEEQSIKHVIENIKDTVSGILVIDDGSSDNTTKYAKEAGAEVITFPENRGKGNAMRKGYEYFVNSDYDISIIFDADGQYRKEDIIPTCNPILEHTADLVVGSRFIGKYQYNANVNYKTMIMCNNISTTVTRVMSRLPTTDSQSGLVAMSRIAASKLDLKAKRWGIHQELIIRAGKKGLKYCEVPIIFEKRMHGVSRLKVMKYPFTAFPVMLKAWIRN
jgi:glycosyltransferase involved in cell wall biosynthesis